MKWTQGAKGWRKVDEEDKMSEGDREREQTSTPVLLLPARRPLPRSRAQEPAGSQQVHGAHVPSTAQSSRYSPGTL